MSAADWLKDQITREITSEWHEAWGRRLQKQAADARVRESIARLAREYREVAGRPSGRDLEFWVRAEQFFFGGR